MTIVEECRRVGESHNRNGERRTADLLFRAAAHILELETIAAKERAATTRRNIISSEQWDALIAEYRGLQLRVSGYRLPTQRGACNNAKNKLREVSAKIRAVDGVIGIDA